MAVDGIWIDAFSEEAAELGQVALDGRLVDDAANLVELAAETELTPKVLERHSTPSLAF